jgi:hypothetical protein
LSRTLPPRLVLIVMALAALLGLLAIATDGHRGPDDGGTHQRPDHHRRTVDDRGIHNLRGRDLGTDQQ